MGVEGEGVGRWRQKWGGVGVQNPKNLEGDKFSQETQKLGREMGTKSRAGEGRCTLKIGRGGGLDLE